MLNITIIGLKVGLFFSVDVYLQDSNMTEQVPVCNASQIWE